MDFKAQSHLTYTLKTPSLVDNLHFIDTLTGTVITGFMVMMYSDSEHPLQCISLTQTMDEISVLVALLSMISIITLLLPRMLLWFFMPCFTNFVENKCLTIAYLLGIIFLAKTSYARTGELYNVFDILITGISGLAIFKLISVLKRSTNSVGPMFTLIALGIMCVLIGVICTIFISLLVVSLARRQSTDYSHIVSFVGRVISCLLMCKINSRFFKSQKYRFIPGLVTMFLYVLCVSIELLITNKSCLKL